MSELINGNKKTPWQKKQAIDAISLLFKSIYAPLYQEIDWDYWKSSCQDLGKEHDTNYRSTHPITNPIKPSSLPLDLMQEKNVSAEINNLRIAIRRLNYAIRTEKTYSDWVQKFLKFNRYKNQSEIDQKGVIKFLEYLAIDRNVAPKTQSVALNAVAFYFKHVLGREW